MIPFLPGPILGEIDLEFRIQGRRSIVTGKPFFHDAIKALFITRPTLRYEIAVDRYRNREISLWKAAETAGLTIEEFKELLASRGVKIEISSSKEESDIRLKKVF